MSAGALPGRRGGNRVAGGRVAAAMLRAPGLVVRLIPQRFRRRLAFLLAACILLAAGYQFWLRDSSLVAVDDVRVTGLTTKDAPRVRAALASAAHTMTTLHVVQADLERAIAAYPVVRAIEVHPDFPHRLEIHVVEHRPAAMVGGLPVAGDGTILRGLPVEGSLPTIDPAGKLSGDRLTAAATLHAAKVAGGAPGSLRGRLEHVDMRPEQGIVVEVRDGPELIFGDATHVRQKWIGATRVLADPESAGASYIDVTLPGRPAAGGLPAATLSPVAPAGTAELAAPIATEAPDTAVDPATEELAPPAAAPPAEEAAPAPTPPATTPPQSSPEAETVGGGAGPAPPG